MSRLQWGAVGRRFYETGVDRGVLYVGANPGVPWTGLISVSESPSGGDPRPYYQDGIKYLNLQTAEEFAATLNAFSSPPEFSPCDGMAVVQHGLFATQQPRKSFNLSYRTLVGNDLEGQNYGYKIHLVYNALAGPTDRDNKSLGGNVDPSSYTWELTTTPPRRAGIRPTAHFVIDTRYTSDLALAALEDILYGSNVAEARMPSVDELFTLFSTTHPPFKAVLVSGNVYEIHEVDAVNSRAVAQAIAPAPPAAGEEPILWFDTSAGSYAVPHLITGG